MKKIKKGQKKKKKDQNKCGVKIVWIQSTWSWIYVNTDCNDQDGDYAKVYNGMNQNGNPACAHVPELYNPYSCWYLEQQPWWQEDEQNHGDNDWPPICTHLSLSLSLELKRKYMEETMEFLLGCEWEKTMMC